MVQLSADDDVASDGVGPAGGRAPAMPSRFAGVGGGRPASDVQLAPGEGAARDVTPVWDQVTDEMRPLEERLADSRAENAVLRARGQARDALEELDASVVHRQVEFARWLSRELTNFLADTGRNPSLALSAAEWTALVEAHAPKIATPSAPASGARSSGAVPVASTPAVAPSAGGREAVGAAAGYATKKVGSKVFGAAVKGGVGAASGSSLSGLAAFGRWSSRGLGGFIVQVAASAIFDGLVSLLVRRPSQAEIDDEAHRALMELVQKNSEVVFDTLEGGLNDWGRDKTELQGWIDRADAPAELQRLEAWSTAQLAAIDTKEPLPEGAISFDLLERWVLQHAGDERHAAADTNEDSWQDASNALDMRVARSERGAGEHGYKREDGAIAKRTLFEDQCRREWARFGLDPEPGLANLREWLRARQAYGEAHPFTFVPTSSWHYDYVAFADRAQWKEAVYAETRPLMASESWRVTRVRLELQEWGAATIVREFSYELYDRIGALAAEFSRSPK